MPWDVHTQDPRRRRVLRAWGDDLGLGFASIRRGVPCVSPGSPEGTSPPPPEDRERDTTAVFRSRRALPTTQVSKPASTARIWWYLVPEHAPRGSRKSAGTANTRCPFVSTARRKSTRWNRPRLCSAVGAVEMAACTRECPSRTERKRERNGYRGFYKIIV